MRQVAHGGGGAVLCRQALTDMGRGGKGHEAGEMARDGVGVAHAAEKAMEAVAGDGGEVVGEVEARHHRLARVGRGGLRAGAAAGESVGGGMRRDGVEQGAQQAALEAFEQGFGFLDQAGAAGWFRDQVEAVVGGEGVGLRIGEAAQVGKTDQLRGRQAEMGGEVVRRGQRRQVEGGEGGCRGGIAAWSSVGAGRRPRRLASSQTGASRGLVRSAAVRSAGRGA